MKKQLNERCKTAAKDLSILARDLALEAGPHASSEVAQQVSQSLCDQKMRWLKLRGTELPKRPSNDESPSALAQWIQACEEAYLQRDVASYVLSALDPLIDTANRLHDYANERAKGCDRLRVTFHMALNSAKKPGKHFVLTEDMLQGHIASHAGECVRVARQACWDASSADAVYKSVADILANHAKTFQNLDRIDNALVIAPEPAQTILQRVLIAAEPGVRVNHLWDYDKHTSRHLFTSLPSDHSLASGLRQAGREVKYCASSDSEREWQFVTIDSGIEVGALLATLEAREAYLADPDPNFPVFFDKGYVPITRLWTPPADEWFCCVALVFHRCLDKEAVRRDGRGVYFKGVLLGEDYVEASREIRKHKNRNPQLPTFAELAEATEALLERGRKPADVVKVLKTIEAKLRRQFERLGEHADLNSARERLVRDEELAVVERLVERYARLAKEMDEDEEIWGD